VKYLVGNRADINASGKSELELLIPACALTQISEPDGTTSLYVASQNGVLDVVTFLVDKGANVHASGMSSHGTSESCM
jgi:ankyrin repeat protein